MIDLFTIIGKGGIVLWCFQGTKNLFAPSINTLIRDVFLQERGNISTFNHDNLVHQFKLDNEFELIFLVVYQNVIQLSYVDKLLTDVQQKFRDMYKNVLEDKMTLYTVCGTDHFDEFGDEFALILKDAQNLTKGVDLQKTMRTFEESAKSQKTVASMIQQPQSKKTSQIPVKEAKAASVTTTNGKQDKPAKPTVTPLGEKQLPVVGSAEDDDVARRRKEFIDKQTKGKQSKIQPPKEKEEKGKKKKELRTWGTANVDIGALDYSAPISAQNGSGDKMNSNVDEDAKFVQEQLVSVGKSSQLRDIAVESDSEEFDEEEDDEIDNVEDENVKSTKKSSNSVQGNTTSRFGVLSAFKYLVGSKKLSAADLAPVLDKMRDHLISKNVAADIADKLCQSVATKLEGKVIGTFSGVTSTIKETLRESLVQILSPKRRIDILRDILEAKRQKRPYTIVFCGVNGVGKSTNLAKITFWLNENGHKVLIAACDTFRAGAVEQLRTHSRHLNALHADSVHLYEQGYGKDAAAVAAQAISLAGDSGFDVVLVDTAGRMQDNEPLMRALAKLIRVNTPDLVLFVGEALVGNEAVDQLVKFNQALADNAEPGSPARLIDGILLTKFDTIDDKVGAAISMTYITGQPIVFVGTGQTYTDLKNLNANAVVHSLLR